MLRLLALVCLISTWPLAARNPSTLLGLPIGPGGPEEGPYEIEIWPYEGCKSCHWSKEDGELYAKTGNDLKSGDAQTLSNYTVKAHVVRFSQGLSDTEISFAELHRLVANCDVGAQGFLTPDSDSSQKIAAGVGLDCLGKDQREFLSFTFFNHKLISIYYLPNQPVWVAEAPAVAHP